MLICLAIGLLRPTLPSPDLIKAVQQHDAIVIRLQHREIAQAQPIVPRTADEIRAEQEKAAAMLVIPKELTK